KADWGIPQYMRVDTVGGAQQRYWSQIGSSNILFNYGLTNTFSLGNLQAHVQFRGAWGGDVWNAYQHTMYAAGIHPHNDQYYKPDSLRKPNYYYGVSRAPGQGDSFSGLSVNNSTYGYGHEIIPDNKWIKLSQLQLAYAMTNKSYRFLDRFGAQRLQVELQG